MSNSISITSKGSLILASLLSVTLMGCNQANSEMTNNVIKPVKLIEVPDLHGPKFDRFIAEVDATQRASLSFQVGGEVESVDVRMGAIVNKGDILASIDSRDFKLLVDVKQAEFDLVKTQFNRAKQLIEKRLISKDSYDQIRTAYTAADADLKQAKTDLEHTVIRAPFDGIVSIIFTKSNQIIAPNQAVMNVIDNNVMDIAFTIPSSYVEQFGLEMVKSNPLYVVMDSHPGENIQAQFKEISTQPNPDTSSFTATATIQKPSNVNLLSGMTGQVKLLNSVQSHAYHPVESAWVEKESMSGVLMRFDPSTEMVNRISVTLDAQGNVIQGLSEGDLLVEAGLDELIDGQIVKAWTREAGI
ncbi:efflux RND transporter periplasmic adaptor subunit [uncultured Vibrio sp.]|uniref:efflux RND transporter periplasmic adaptor subunit n=1 Tax=uncultured Vibrio sp. TaxID=114054 RepID=UPI0025CD3B54|nr:efflux RND transporter periplasmic adaptor subunit [uncultured Vibrio sp.]